MSIMLTMVINDLKVKLGKHVNLSISQSVSYLGDFESSVTSAKR